MAKKARITQSPAVESENVRLEREARIADIMDRAQRHMTDAREFLMQAAKRTVQGPVEAAPPARSRGARAR